MIALFGANGYLGRQLDHYFTGEGMEVERFDIPECDVSDSNFWTGFDPARYTAILFFAGITGTEAGFADAIRYTRVNDLGLLHLLIKLSPLGRMAPKVIFPSSRLVYRGSDAPLSEEAPKEAKTVYAANKIACELYLEAYRNRFGIPYAVVRICVPYGNLISSDYSYGTIGFFMRQIAQGKPIALFGGGKQGRTFTHVADICTAVKLLMDCSENGIFNVGGENMSLYEAALKVVGGDTMKVQAAEWPLAALLVESGSTMFDSTKLEKLGWKARHRL